MQPERLDLPTGIKLPGEPELILAADVYLPAAGFDTILVCFPGGAMNRHYWDLRATGGDISFSFAEQMAARGFAVAAIDHPGVGESTRPTDSYALDLDLIARANVAATRALLEGLRAGTLIPGVAALPGLKSVVVGHSMGAMFAIVQQANAKQHAGVAALGFATRGLPDFTPMEARALAGDHARLRAEAPRLARAMFVTDYPIIKPTTQANGIYGGSAADPKAIQALKAAHNHLLPVPAFLSIVPGNVSPEAAAIDVPVFLAVGERDMTGPPNEIPAAFSSSPKVDLQVLAEAGHSHFLFASRVDLFDHLADWARNLG